MSNNDQIRCRCRGHNSPEIIDPCIRELVDCLNRHGIKTIASCCGHGIDTGEILIDGSMIEEWKDGMIRLRTRTRPVVYPYDDDQNEWIEKE